jgi:hypothetical protein
MQAILRALLVALSRSFPCRRDLVLENLALRQQLVVLAAKHPHPRLVVIQQLREAFPCDSAPRYLIFDRGANFNGEVVDAINSFAIQPRRTRFRRPWQNGVAERFVGNFRRDLLDQVIVR